jgi:5'-deoxynucleotidase YfbR-like HD superfamily hydrolase
MSNNKLHPAIVEGTQSPQTAVKPETRQSKPTKSAIRTYTGILFDFEEPEASPICIEDIAHALSLLCRFAGHCKEFYSVAEHSIRVSDSCPAEHALWGLMHDASEAYCVDVPRPLKHMPNMEHYRAHEKRVMRAICGWFNMSPFEPAEVKHMDNVLLVTEQRDLLANSIPDFNIKPLEWRISPITSRQAEREFLRRFEELKELNKPFCKI